MSATEASANGSADVHAADLPGVLRGEELAQAYANMDVFVFPSRTDTFGNVVLGGFCLRVPAVVTGAGGPKFIVREGKSGFVAGDDEDFVGSYRGFFAIRALGRKWRGMRATSLWGILGQRV